MRQKTFTTIYTLFRMGSWLEQFSLLGSGSNLLKKAEYAPIVGKAGFLGLADESMAYGANDTTQTA